MKKNALIALALFSSILFLTKVYAQDVQPPAPAAASPDNLRPYVEMVQKTQEGMSLWEVLHSGGVVMIILGALSVIMLGLVLFLFFYLNASKLAPEELGRKVASHIINRDLKQAGKLCRENETLVSTIALAGIDKADQSADLARESIEIIARREIAHLWALFNYLTDIIQVSPMLGLLGTVLGMIQAFNTIAFQSGVVKPVLLAGGVSKAMVNTAAGLILAIAGTLAYSVLRPRVQKITNTLENSASLFVEAFSR